jgi:hypothetical protein
MKPLKLKYVQAGGANNVTLIDCLDYIDLEFAAQQMYTELPQTTNSTDILVLRMPVDRMVANFSEIGRESRPFCERMPNASIYALGSSDFSIRLSDNLNSQARNRIADDERAERFLPWLQDEELRSFVYSSPALFQSRPSSIFYSPSGRYAKNFLRVGSIQTSRRVLDAIFFWCLPHLRDCSAVVCETWSISSIALNIGRLLERYHTVPGFRCRVDMLSRYHDESHTFRDEMRDALRRAEASRGQTLFLMSCVMTGNSFELLKQSITELGNLSDPHYLSLYKLNQGIDIKSLCTLCDKDRDVEFSATFERPSGSVVISMDRQTYFPIHISERKIPIYREAAQLQRSFFQSYKGMGVFSTHRDARDRNGMFFRHHGIYVDVSKMLRSATFRKKIFEQISVLHRPPKLILVPHHTAGIDLVKFIKGELQSKFNVDVPYILTNDAERDISDSERELICAQSGSDAIMIVDDVSVSGSRLSRYQLNLRRMNHLVQLIYFIGVARPDDAAEWKRRSVELAHRDGYEGADAHRVIAIETVVLPDLNRNDCPWCQELLALDRLYTSTELASIGKDKTIVERIKRLDAAPSSGGLIDDVIWARANSSLKLTENSLFMTGKTASEADVVPAVAATLQVLRTFENKQRRLETFFPTATIINPRDYLGTKFNDPLLRCAIVRACYRYELECWTDSGEAGRERSLQHLLLSVENQELVIELALQIVLKKLPALRLTSEQKNLLIGVPMGNVAVGLLTKANRLISNSE